MARERKKYSSELKHQVVQDYLEGNGSLRKLCKQYGISDKSHYGNGFHAIMVIKTLRSAPAPEARSI